MKATTNGFKTILSSGNARKYVIKIDLTLANNTVLHLTEADIWEDSFSIDTASSGTSSFDIGCAIIGKCTFTINNIDGDFDNYDFFNATAVVWLGLVGDTVSSTQQYYKMGTYTVDEPSKANGLVSLTLLDYMWKFDRPIPALSLPATAMSVVNSLCSYCGVVLGSVSFHGSSFSVPEFENKDDMNCRELLQYVIMIGCNFCTMNADGQLIIKWYNTSATAATTPVFDYNFNTSFGTEDIAITGIKTTIDKVEHTLGSSGYVLEIENPLINANNVNTALNLIWDVLHANNTNFTLRTFNITTASDLSAEIGDKCKIRDYEGNYVYSWITTNSFKLAAHQIQCNAIPPQRTLVTRYSKTVQTAVAEARRQTAEQLSNYDQVVQLMNELAVNAMGGFEEYEDAQTGGRIWYWSNMSITKVNNVCSFEPNSVVFKKTGTGLFVSSDGGTTWGNAYDAQTGKLVVNMLYAIGINFDWARGGTLTLGGFGNGYGELSIRDASDIEKVHGDNGGVKVGANTGSQLRLTTTGHIDYYYDNTYMGMMKMNARDYSSTSTPDLHDTFEIREFDDERISTSSDYSYLQLHNNNATGAYSGYGIQLHTSGDAKIDGNNVTVDSNAKTRITSADMVVINGTNGLVLGQDGGLIGGCTVYPDGYTGSNDPTGATDVIRIVNGSTYQDWQVINGFLCHVTGTGDVPYITYGTTDLNAGSSPLPTGEVYLVYE